MGIMLLGIGALSAALILGLVGPRKASPPSAIIYASPPTAEQLRAAKNAVRANGIITAIAATGITFTLSGQKEPVMLKLTDKTKYMHGKRGATADKSTLESGQKSVVAYDKSTLVAVSVWGGYDE